MPTIKKIEKKPYYNSDKKKLRAKYYNKVEWKKLRQWHLMEHPLCEMCLDENTIIQFLLSDSNLMSLCKWHHSQQHIRHKKMP